MREMAKNLPKYVSLKRSSYHYQRQIPTRYQHITKSKYFTFPLGLKLGATEVELATAAQRAGDEFERFCRLLSVSDPAALSAQDIEHSAHALLKRRGISQSSLEKIPYDPHLDEVGRASLGAKHSNPQFQFDAKDYAALEIPEIEEIAFKSASKQFITPVERIAATAYKLLVTQKNRKINPTLSTAWKDYVRHKKLDVQSRVGRKTQVRWDRFIQIIGDRLLAPTLDEQINGALQDYVETRRDESVKEQTIQRELAEVLACLRFAAKKHSFKWVILRPELASDEESEKSVLSKVEQALLVKYCLNPERGRAHQAAVLLLALQGGCSASEIARLPDKDIHLDEEIPFIAIFTKTKTTHRKRVVPIVLGLNIIRENIKEARAWMKTTTESNWSAVLKDLLRRITKNQALSAYSCRHTFRLNARLSNVSVVVINDIGGWSGQRDMSKQMLQYGSSALAGSDSVRHLYEQSAVIHRDLLDIC
jgi:integrase